MTDKELVTGIRNNSEAAWKAIYSGMKPGIRLRIEPMLLRVKDVMFDDIYNEALMLLMENVKDGKLTENNADNLSGYLYTICYRLALKRLRKTLPTEDISDSIMKSPYGETKVDEIEEDPNTLLIEDEWVRNFLDRVLDSLPLNCKQILKRFYWEELSMDEIAPIMGLKNANSAKTTKNRCMDKFKKLATDLLADDEKAEEAIRRAVERNALRDLLERFRQEDSGEIATAACKSGKTVKSPNEE